MDVHMLGKLLEMHSDNKKSRSLVRGDSTIHSSYSGRVVCRCVAFDLCGWFDQQSVQTHCMICSPSIYPVLSCTSNPHRKQQGLRHVSVCQNLQLHNKGNPSCIYCATQRSLHACSSSKGSQTRLSHKRCYRQTYACENQ